jgi:hypothetical protein
MALNAGFDAALKAAVPAGTMSFSCAEARSLGGRRPPRHQPAGGLQHSEGFEGDADEQRGKQGGWRMRGLPWMQSNVDGNFQRHCKAFFSGYESYDPIKVMADYFRRKVFNKSVFNKGTVLYSIAPPLSLTATRPSLPRLQERSRKFMVHWLAKPLGRQTQRVTLTHLIRWMAAVHPAIAMQIGSSQHSNKSGDPVGRFLPTLIQKLDA